MGASQALVASYALLDSTVRVPLVGRVGHGRPLVGSVERLGHLIWGYASAPSVVAQWAKAAISVTASGSATSSDFLGRTPR